MSCKFPLLDDHNSLMERCAFIINVSQSPSNLNSLTVLAIKISPCSPWNTTINGLLILSVFLRSLDFRTNVHSFSFFPQFVSQFEECSPAVTMNCQRVYFWEPGDGTLLSLTVHFLGNKFLRFNCSFSWELQGTNLFVLTVPCLGNFMEQISPF